MLLDICNIRLCSYAILFIGPFIWNDSPYRYKVPRLPVAYCKTLNDCVYLISWISRAKQNRKIMGANIKCRPKIGRNYYSISNYMVLIRQSKGVKIILHAKSPTFRSAKLKHFTVHMSGFIAHSKYQIQALFKDIHCVSKKFPPLNSL